MKKGESAVIESKLEAVENWVTGIVYKHHYATLAIDVDKNDNFAFVSSKK